MSPSRNYCGHQAGSYPHARGILGPSTFRYFFSHNLDAFFFASIAPGRSAYNRVECKMALVSRELSGLILLHDHFESHLNPAGKAIEDELEIQNFGFAGQVLSEIWSAMDIDGFPTVAEFIHPASSELDVQNLKKRWLAKHVRTLQYLTKIGKCQDWTCCSASRSSYFCIFPPRFLPPPIPLSQKHDGLKAQEREDFDSRKFPSLFVLPQKLNR